MGEPAGKLWDEREPRRPNGICGSKTLVPNLAIAAENEEAWCLRAWWRRGDDEVCGKDVGARANHGDQTGFGDRRICLQTCPSSPSTKRLVPPGLVADGSDLRAAGKTLGRERTRDQTGFGDRRICSRLAIAAENERLVPPGLVLRAVMRPPAGTY